MKFLFKRCCTVSFLSLLIATFTLSSCEGLKKSSAKKKKIPSYIVTLNEIVKYPRAQTMEKRVPTFDGRTIWVKTHPVLSSKSIESVKLVKSTKTPDYYDLSVKLDHHGALVFMKLSNDKAHPPWAFLIDGMYYRSIGFKTPTTENDTQVMIEGPFDSSVAKMIAKYGALNYKYFHADD